MSVCMVGFTEDLGPETVVMVIKLQGSIAKKPHKQTNKNGHPDFKSPSSISFLPWGIFAASPFSADFHFPTLLSLSPLSPGGVFQQLFSFVEDNRTY